MPDRQAPPTRRQAIVVCVFTAATAIACAVLLGAAVLVPAPTAVAPVVILVGIGLPMATATELPAAAAVLRSARRARDLERDAIEAMRRHLAQLPETDHPLGG